MTEAEWLASDDPAAMLTHLNPRDIGECARHGIMGRNSRCSDRKLRLFACACCRAVGDGTECESCDGSGSYTYVNSDENWGSFNCSECDGTGRVGGIKSKTARKVIDAAERYADGEIPLEQLQAADQRWNMRNAYNYDPTDILVHICIYEVRGIVAASQARDREIPPAAQAALLREIFGNPWRPMRRTIREVEAGNPYVELVPDMPWLRWQDGLVPRLAKAIYDERAWGQMGVLHDALLDAGCDDAELLMHCRGLRRAPGCSKDWCLGTDYRWAKCPVCGSEWSSEYGCRVVPSGVPTLHIHTGKVGELAKQTVTYEPAVHARGCWALDLLLGKA